MKIGILGLGYVGLPLAVAAIRPAAAIPANPRP
jgi:UDP-N-acetyl-D-mannosaminuronate dehydrogenase